MTLPWCESLAKWSTPIPIVFSQILQSPKAQFHKQLVGRAFVVQSPAHMGPPGSQSELGPILGVSGGQLSVEAEALCEEDKDSPAQRQGLQISSQEYEATP